MMIPNKKNVDAIVKIEGVRFYDDSYRAVLLGLHPFPSSEYEELINDLITSNVVRSLPSRSGLIRQVVNEEELSLLASVDPVLSLRVARLRESGSHVAALVTIAFSYFKKALIDFLLNGVTFYLFWYLKPFFP
jgi:hypothetical protein